MATATPVKYAETTLGVHTEYEALESLIAQLHDVRKMHVQLVGTVRSLRLTQDEVEQDVSRKLRNTEEFPSQAAFDRKLKEVLADDESYADLKRDIVGRQNDAESIEAEVRTLEIQVKAKTARIGEVGDYLRWLAACKDAQTEAKRQEKDPSKAWPV